MKLVDYVKSQQCNWGNNSSKRPAPLWYDVYLYLKDHPRTTSAQISRDLKIDQDKINKALQALRMKGKAESVRYWRIKEVENNLPCDKKNKYGV